MKLGRRFTLLFSLLLVAMFALRYDAKEVSATRLMAQSQYPAGEVVAKGTSIHVRLTDSIRADKQGEVFRGELDRAIKIDNRIVAPEKTAVIGQVTKLTRPQGASDPIRIELVLNKLKVGERTVALETEPLEFIVPRGAEARYIYRQTGGDPDVIYRSETRLTFRLAKPVRLSPAAAKTE